MNASATPPSGPERLAYWYLRLNGFLLVENFVVHPDEGSEQRTDADLIGVRSAYRSENLREPMIDDPKVAGCDRLVNVIIAEVKRSVCALNGPWTRPEDRNIHRVLSAVGCLPADSIPAAADALYRQGEYLDGSCRLRLMAFGDVRAKNLSPAVQQITFDHMRGFIHRRFRDYRREKRSVGNWSEDGRILAAIADDTRSEREFRQRVRMYFQLRAEAPTPDDR